jgi:hypothetical protein
LRGQHVRPHWPDTDGGSHAEARPLDELRQHRRCCLADGDDFGRRTARQRIGDRRIAKRGSDEDRGISRANGCAQNLLQVASKVVNGTNQ